MQSFDETHLKAALEAIRAQRPYVVAKTASWVGVDRPPSICGIYALLWAGEIVYIGKSTDVFVRLCNHRKPGVEFKLFDGVKILRVRRENLDFMESALIHAMHPKYNKQLPPMLSLLKAANRPCFAGRIKRRATSRLAWDLRGVTRRFKAFCAEVYTPELGQVGRSKSPKTVIKLS